MKTEMEILNKLYFSLPKRWKPIQEIGETRVVYASDYDGVTSRHDYVTVNGLYLQGDNNKIFAVVKGGPSDFDSRTEFRVAYTILPKSPTAALDLSKEKPLPLWKATVFGRWPWGEVTAFTQSSGKRISYRTSEMGMYDDIEVPEKFVFDKWLYKNELVDFLFEKVVTDLEGMEPQVIESNTSSS